VANRTLLELLIFRKFRIDFHMFNGKLNVYKFLHILVYTGICYLKMFRGVKGYARFKCIDPSNWRFG
jgi:hypothetical protein